MSDELVLCKAFALSDVRHPRWVAAAEEQDFLSVSAIMCHAGEPANGNGDAFREEDLREQADTNSIFSPLMPGIIDDQHNCHPYGVWQTAQLLAHNGRTGVRVDGVVFAWRYPEFAASMREAFQKDDLWFSMMCRPSFVECGSCGLEFTNSTLYCDHLKDRRETGTIRWLRYPQFLAASKVDRPADADAEALSLAARRELLLSQEEFARMTFSDRVGLYYAMMFGER